MDNGAVAAVLNIYITQNDVCILTDRALWLSHDCGRPQLSADKVNNNP